MVCVWLVGIAVLVLTVTFSLPLSPLLGQRVVYHLWALPSGQQRKFDNPDLLPPLLPLTFPVNGFLSPQRGVGHPTTLDYLSS